MTDEIIPTHILVWLTRLMKFHIMAWVCKISFHLLMTLCQDDSLFSSWVVWHTNETASSCFFRMAGFMPFIRPHQFILMQNMQQTRCGQSRLKTTFREFQCRNLWLAALYILPYFFEKFLNMSKMSPIKKCVYQLTFSHVYSYLAWFIYGVYLFF